VKSTIKDYTLVASTRKMPRRKMDFEAIFWSMDKKVWEKCEELSSECYL